MDFQCSLKVESSYQIPLPSPPQKKLPSQQTSCHYPEEKGQSSLHKAHVSFSYKHSTVAFLLYFFFKCLQFAQTFKKNQPEKNISINHSDLNGVIKEMSFSFCCYIVTSGKPPLCTCTLSRTKTAYEKIQIDFTKMFILHSIILCIYLFTLYFA